MQFFNLGLELELLFLLYLHFCGKLFLWREFAVKSIFLNTRTIFLLRHFYFTVWKEKVALGRGSWSGNGRVGQVFFWGGG